MLIQKPSQHSINCLSSMREREAFNSYEVIGEFAGQFLMAFLLWKKWIKSIDSVKPEEVINEKN